ncbi:MAG: carotenoid 1,2-hydratase, partial [Pseudomonadota bacterium]
MGSVFSPYYYWAGRKDPENHVSFNVALYGPHSNRWTMTERSSAALSRDQTHFSLGKSAMAWDGEVLTLNLHERAVPHLSRVSGSIRLTPKQLTSETHELAPKHYWWPHAPSAEIEVTLDQPELNWHGNGYLDQNWGDEPIEAGFGDRLKGGP